MSTGLAGRKSGDIFRDTNNVEIIFNSIKLFPIEEISNIDQQVVWLNQRKSNMSGFAVIEFGSSNENLYFGRYLLSIKPNLSDNYISNAVGEYKLASKSAKKIQSGLTPQELLYTKSEITSQSIIDQLSYSLGKNHPLYKLAERINNGEPLPIIIDRPADISFSAFRDYFCEILQPIALQNGQYIGNGAEAAKIFLNENTFENTLISFDESKNAGLNDSVLTSIEHPGQVKISSKGAKGATASTANLINSIQELQKTKIGKKLLKKYKNDIELIQQIQKQGQANSPLYLGLKYRIINKSEYNQIQNLKSNNNISIDAIATIGLSSNLLKLAKSRTTVNSTSISLYYHLIAAVAHKAVIAVNEKTNFSKAAADILNHGALVQVYTNAKERKEHWVLEKFETVYPGESIKGVYLSAQKTYYSTKIKGNFTFTISR